jgi:hypothetical protein
MTDDDPDWAEFVDAARTVSEIDCARLRRLLLGSSRSLTELSEERFGAYSRTQLSKHANGRCTHDHGVPAVECVKRWEPQESAGENGSG